MIVLCFLIACAICAGVYYIGRKDGKRETWEYVNRQIYRVEHKFDFKAPELLEQLITKTPNFTLNEYQKRAANTINYDLTPEQMALHAMFGMMSEVGEMASIFQKVYQGHDFDTDHLFSEMGDAMWFEAELATAFNRLLGSVTEHNIEKLEKRYKHGFSEGESLNRAEGDI